MKGVLFNVVEDVVDETLPADSWDRALEDGHLHGAYTSMGSYPDGELTTIVGSLAGRTGLDQADVLRHAGRHGFAHLVRRQPDLMDGFDDLGALLHGLDDVIHPEVLKLYPEANPPRFEVTDLGPGSWQLLYRSDRQLCHLAEGLIEGAGVHFGAATTITQTECTLDGASRCVLLVESRPEAPPSP